MIKTKSYKWFWFVDENSCRSFTNGLGFPVQSETYDIEENFQFSIGTSF